MQNKGFRVTLILLFLGLPLYSLFPTLQSYRLTSQLERLEGEEREECEQENYSRIRSARERALKLGLDLQGGMHVGLEVRTDALISELATDKDDMFEEVLSAAQIGRAA